MEKILPQDQALFPVSFKRKLVYEGYFLEEIIDRDKTVEWFKYLKKNNPHFKDIELKIELIDEFEESTRIAADKFEETPKVVMTDPEDEILKEIEEEIPLGKQNTTLMSDKYEIDPNDKTYQNKLADMIIECEIMNGIPQDNEDDGLLEEMFWEDFDVQSQENEDEEDRMIPKTRTSYNKISIAPGEEGKFKSWNKDDIFIEEKAFPSLFIHGKARPYFPLYFVMVYNPSWFI